MTTLNRFFGAILLIAGTSIGAGMLALPVATAKYGFIPTILLFILCWLAMVYSALCMLEANLWFPKEANLISMAKETLGRGGEIASWILYLLLMYSLMSAYLSGMNDLLINFVTLYLHLPFSPLLGAFILAAIFGIIIYLGATTIDYLNRFLMVGLIISYLLLVFLLFPQVNIANLKAWNFQNAWFTIPIIITSFGFQIIIPSLRTYLDTDVKKLRLAIIIGSSIPLFVYIIWEFLILGVLPLTGSYGLLPILASGQPATGLATALEKILHNSLVVTAIRFFAFYAIATSFIGVSFSLFDFLTDGLHLKKNHVGRFIGALITFLPPLIFALTYPRGFIIALGFAGIFVALLLMFLPALIVISGRYWKRIPSYYKVKGGLPLLLALCFFSFVIILVELLPAAK